MKYLLMSAAIFFSMTVCAQSESVTARCHAVDSFLDDVSSTYYWGSPKWLAMMDSALTLCPTSAKAWGNKAMIYLMRGDVATWYAFADQAVKRAPLYYLGNRAWHRMRYLRDYEGAWNDLQSQDSLAGFASIYVSDVHSYILMGQCKEGMGDTAAALDYYNQSLERQIKERGENWIGTYDYLIRGILKYKLNDLAGALADLNQQVKSDEQLVDTYYYRGLVHQKLERPDQARIDFENAKALLLGQGFKRWDQQVILMNEVYVSDIDQALRLLN